MARRFRRVSRARMGRPNRRRTVVFMPMGFWPKALVAAAAWRLTGLQTPKVRLRWGCSLVRRTGAVGAWVTPPLAALAVRLLYMSVRVGMTPALRPMATVLMARCSSQSVAAAALPILAHPQSLRLTVLRGR